MADIVVKVLADLKALRKDITKSLKETFKVDVESDIKGTAGGKDSAGIVGTLKEELKDVGKKIDAADNEPELKALLAKQTELKNELGSALKSGSKSTLGGLGKVVAKLLPLGILASLKPIQQTLELLLGFATFGLLKIIKLLGGIVNFFPDLEPGEATEAAEGVVDSIEGVQDNIGDLLEAIKVQETLQQIQSDISKGIILSVDDVRKILEENGISQSVFLEDFVSGLDQLQLATEDGTSTVSEAMDDAGDLLEEALEDVGTEITDMKKELGVDVNATTKEVKESLAIINKDLEENKSELTRIKDNLSVIEGLLNFLEPIFNFFKNILSRIGIRRRTEDVDDAIIKPDGTIIRTNPNDTLIATQNPENLGGGKTIIINAPGMDEVIKIVRREFGADIVKTGRF